MAETRRILIVGCPRSGTTYLAKLLQAYGLDVGHEKMGADGTSSWPMAAGAVRPPWGPSRRNYRFQCVLHLVRDPLSVVASMQTLKPVAWEYMRTYVLVHRQASLIEQGVQAYVGWNKLINAQAPLARLQVEGAEEKLPPALQKWGLIPPGPPRSPLPPKDVNTRPHAPLTWADLRSQVPAPLLVEFAALVKAYGYPLEEAVPPVSSSAAES